MWIQFDGSDIRSHCDRVARIKRLFVDSERAPKRRGGEGLLERETIVSDLKINATAGALSQRDERALHSRCSINLRSRIVEAPKLSPERSVTVRSIASGLIAQFL